VPGTLAPVERTDPRPPGAPVRVVHVLTRLSRSAGIQIVVRRLAHHLDPAAIEMHVVTVRPRLERDQLELLPVAVHPLGHLGLDYTLRKRLRVLRDVTATVTRLRPEVVQLHSGTAWLGLGARLRNPRARFLLEVHDAPGSGRHGRATDWFEGVWTRRLGAHVVCHSSSVAAEVRSRWRRGADDVTVIPLAVDTDRFVAAEAAARRAWREEHELGSDTVVLVVVGRLAPSKRFDEAIRVLARLRERDLDVVLVIVGGGKEEERLRDLARTLGVTDAVRFVGPRVDEELVAALGAADVLCSTSEYEGFGLTVIEAMACGLPVVATAVGGVTDLVADGETGHLVALDDADGFTEAVAGLVADPARRRELGDAGRRRVEERFSVAGFAAEFARLYLRLAATGPRRGGR